MRWRKSPPELIAVFDAALPDDRRVQRRSMFGYPRSPARPPAGRAPGKVPAGQHAGGLPRGGAAVKLRASAGARSSRAARGR